MNDENLIEILYKLSGKVDTDCSYIIEKSIGKIKSSLLSDLNQFDKVTIYPRADIMEFRKDVLLAIIGSSGIELFEQKKAVKVKKKSDYKLLKTASGISKKQMNVWIEIPKEGYECSVEKALEYLTRYPEILTICENEAPIASIENNKKK